jgi:hypothetical protein
MDELTIIRDFFVVEYGSDPPRSGAPKVCVKNVFG